MRYTTHRLEHLKSSQRQEFLPIDLHAFFAPLLGPQLQDLFTACCTEIAPVSLALWHATLDFVRYEQNLISMAKVGVPESWLTFPIGTLKAAGALGLLLGLIGVPLIGTAAAIGLVPFFVCAVYTHLLAGDYSPQFGLAIEFLLLAVATLVLGLASWAVPGLMEAPITEEDGVMGRTFRHPVARCGNARCA